LRQNAGCEEVEAAAEVQKLYHDPLELITRAVQPVLWLMLFGEVMARVRGVAPGDIPSVRRS
jgi:ABC-2 type transport system permease protein